MDNQNKILKSMEMIKRAEYMKIIDSEQFLRDPLIYDILNKAIDLGYSLNMIKDIFCDILIEHGKLNLLERENFNYSQIINMDCEKFIDKLVIYCSQNDSARNNKQSSIPAKLNDLNDEFEENDDNMSNFNDEETYDYESVHDANGLKAKENLNGNLMKAGQTKKPMTEQQKFQMEQEYLNEQQKKINDPSNLRPIIVDCKDVALSDHSNKQTFIVSRIKKVVDYFEKRGHQIYLILSQSRRDQIISSSSNSAQKTPDQQILLEMEAKKQVHYTPSKRVGAKRIEQDEDHVKLQLAETKGAIIVSNNNFKKYLNHNEDFKQVIEERVLMYSFIDDTFMPAEDPTGKNGLNLENFLRIEQSVNSCYMKRCPYRKKCTYGAKCKFWHPERGMLQGNQQYKTAHQSVLETAQNEKRILEVILNKSQSDQKHTGLLTKKLFVSQHVPDNIQKSEIQKNKCNFSFETDLSSMSLKNQLQQQQNKFETRPMLRAMGPDPIYSQITSQSNKPNKLSTLLAQQPDSMSGPTTDFMKNNFLDKYGSLTFNNLEDFANKNVNTPENRLRSQLIGHLTQEQADNVIRKYPNEVNIEKLVYLARCLPPSEDDF